MSECRVLGGKVYPEGGYVAELPARGNTGDTIIAKPGVNQSSEIQLIMLEKDCLDMRPLKHKV